MATRINDLLSLNLQCPICLNIYTEPKLLACSHTFCKECLSRLLKSQKQKRGAKISCPVCRKNTAVPGDDVSNLQVNIPLQGMVEDVKNQSQLCTVCKDKPLAATYCVECDDFMCVDCYKTHDKWDKFAGHEIVKVEDIVSGKVMAKSRRKCKKHRSEVEECFCMDCKKYVCFRCGMMEHSKAGHNVLDGMEHEDNQKEKIRELQGKIGAKKGKVDLYLSFIEKEQVNLQVIFEHLTSEISQTCEESIQQMQERRDVLIAECKGLLEGLSKDLQGMKDESRLEMGQIEDIGGLVGNGIKVPLEGESLVAHETLCEELVGILVKGDPDYSRPDRTIKDGQMVRFQRVRCPQAGQNALDLGKIEVGGVWALRKTVSFSNKDSVNCIASMPDGRVAVGSRFGGLTLFSLDGSRSDVLNGVAIRQVVFFPDGRLIIKHIHNNLSVYSKSFDKVDIDFQGLSSDVGGFGGLEVYSKSNTVLCGYSKMKKIFVYDLTAGGKPVNKLKYSFEPQQIFSLRSGGLLVLMDDFTVGILDASKTTVTKQLSKQGIYASPMVCLDGSILIAWVDHAKGSVSIEQYSRDLQKVRSLIDGAKIAVPQHPWYHLREFLSGELAFCTPDNLYIFEKKFPIKAVPAVGSRK